MEITPMAFTLTIRERGNSWAGRHPVTSIHSSQQKAKAELVDYVRRNWDTEMGGGEPPGDEDELIDRYFEDVLEAYEITETASRATSLSPPLCLGARQE
jgi:hypothetical protein